MSSEEEMDTLSQVIEMLQRKGFIENFQMGKDGFTAKKNGSKLKPQNVKIRKVYRFEGQSNPDDMSVLYALETDTGIKGILIDAFGTYAGNDVELIDFLKQVKTEELSS